MDWLRTVDESGYAILPGVLRNWRTDQLLAEIGRSGLRRSKAGVRHLLNVPAISSLALDSQLIAPVREVLGQDAFPFRATFFDKSPESNWLIVWHQDTALPVQARRDLAGWGPWSVKEGIHYAHAPADSLSQVLALRIHLDDSTASNGPLRILPGTHLMGVMDDDRLHDLATKIAPVDCIVLRGGIIAMRPLTVHASSKSQAEAPRRVLHIEYAASASIAEPLALAVA
jgi:ectoine hydroxylase-related dioxygenase (phytanoyl-CoA dioxygenase family)